MKTLLDQNTTAEVFGSIKSRELSIAANAKAFKELISGIYSDKAYAINREYMANAIDAHKMAGLEDRPFDLHLPTQFEPFYSIRDYGISMTDDIVFELFSTLFMSTKDDPNSEESNLQTGKFGLGSKSAFSYTDAFQLTTYLDGVARVYDVYFNNGMPRIDLFHSEETTEENGVRIEFPVNPKDIEDFRRTAVRAIEGIAVPPNFIGHVPQLLTRRVVTQGSGWQLLNSTYTNAAEAHQGTVLYPLNFHAVQGCPSYLEPLFSLPIRVIFPIGELEVITSREALSYDERTSQNIINRMANVAEELAKEVSDKFNASKTFWEACAVFYGDIKKNYPDHFVKLAWPNGKPTFKGREVEEYITPYLSNVREPKKVLVDDGHGGKYEKTEYVTHKRGGNIEMRMMSLSTFCDYKTYKFQRGRDDMQALRVAHWKKIVVIWENMEATNRKADIRLNLLADKLAAQKEADFQAGNGWGSTALIWARGTTKDAYGYRRLLSKAGLPEITFIDLMTVEVPKAVAEKAIRRVLPFKTVNDNGVVSGQQKGTPLPAKAFYLKTRNNVVDVVSYKHSSLSYRSVADFAKLRKVFVDAGEPNIPLILLPASSKKLMEELEADDNYIDFVSYVEENVAALYDYDFHRDTHIRSDTGADRIYGELLSAISSDGAPTFAIKDVAMKEFLTLMERHMRAVTGYGNSQSLVEEFYYDTIDMTERTRLNEQRRTEAQEITSIISGLFVHLVNRYDYLFELLCTEIRWSMHQNGYKEYLEQKTINFLSRI